jgi:hypothetical protein
MRSQPNREGGVVRMIYCLAIPLVLAGCASREQIVANRTAQQVAANRGPIAARRAAQQVALSQADDVRCRKDRGAPGSIAYVACRMNLASNRHVNEGEAEPDR